MGFVRRLCKSTAHPKSIVPETTRAKRTMPRTSHQETAQSTVIEILAKSGRSCNYSCFPSERAEGERSAMPKCRFGLMFLSAVEFLALHGLHVSARTHGLLCVRADLWAFFHCVRSAS